MPLYFFKADYDDRNTAIDDAGVEFQSLKQAQAYAAVVEEELGRNTGRRVTVEVVEGALPGRFRGAQQIAGGGITLIFRAQAHVHSAQEDPTKTRRSVLGAAT
ncbi:MAG TPA: hypothetical protein VH684_17915 [Xanthobacteraceae bacterium]|jgi:hypothetical protein